jgi:uncharacterized protein (TIGR02246 family)
MSRIWLSFSVCLWLVYATGCASPPAVKSLPPRDIGAEVRAEFERSVAAWNAGNLDGFMAIYAEDATFALRDSFLTGAPAIRAFYAPAFAPGGDRPRLTMEELTPEVLALDVVLIRGIYRTNAGRELIGRGTTSLILRHLAGRWRIIHDHST